MLSVGSCFCNHNAIEVMLDIWQSEQVLRLFSLETLNKEGTLIGKSIHCGIFQNERIKKGFSQIFWSTQFTKYINLVTLENEKCFFLAHYG